LETSATGPVIGSDMPMVTGVPEPVAGPADVVDAAELQAATAVTASTVPAAITGSLRWRGRRGLFMG
jgi:uncharacterized protein with von Willebrand factor type A (vWA) domain